MRNSYCMFHCYNIINTYSVVVLANKGVTDSWGGEGQITTSPSCAEGEVEGGEGSLRN